MRRHSPILALGAFWLLLGNTANAQTQEADDAGIRPVSAALTDGVASACFGSSGGCSPCCEPRQRGQWQLGVYGGMSDTSSSDIRYRLGAGNDYTFQDVGWATQPFKNPLYYGVRLTHYLADYPNLGLMLDYTHNKILADLDSPVNVVGIRGGAPVNTRETPRQSLSRLEMTDGINLLTANLIWREFLLQTENHPNGWLQPYAGVGLGVAFPHVETTFQGQPATFEYQWRGPVVQGLVGTHFAVCDWLSIFVEYKYSHVVLNNNVVGGTQRTEAGTHHYIIGPAFNW